MLPPVQKMVADLYQLNIYQHFIGCSVVGKFVIFQKIKVSKHILDPCCNLGSISPTFYEQLLCQNPLTK